MFRRTFKLAWFKRNRYSLTVIAIALSVAFIVSTLLLTTSISDVGAPLNEAYDGVDVVVDDDRRRRERHKLARLVQDFQLGWVS